MHANRFAGHEHPHRHTDADRRHRRFPGRPDRGDAPFGRGDHPGGRGHHRGGGRARRGDVRAAVLALLAEKPMHGYEIIQELDERTGGVWKPSPGSVYPTLTLLEEEGLITSEADGGKRLFTISPAGTEAMTDPTPWAAMVAEADPAQGQLRDAVKAVHVAARQIAEIGTAEQKAKAVELISAVRKELYLILAE